MKKITKKFSKKIRKEKNKVAVTLILLALIFSVFSIFNSIQSKTEGVLDKYEVTEIDIFALESFNANNISVLGVSVGDRTKKLLENLGNPDLQTDFSAGVSSWEYSTSLGLDSAGIIILLDNGIVRTITVRNSFNEQLVGETAKLYSKAELYQKFGIPDDTLFMPIKKDSALIIRVLRYNEIGVDFIVRKNKVIGFSLMLNDETD
ncbi:hypothetical protein HN992_01060 [Candidatus Woesearchaeota archaeon]|jgi:hypothetical protein|nr:hypothetical protein [Candidatus Woesearchaeota archaeon]MBT3438778.1 hypothetical protein [Candidatus Woesearchaeota archaeon]MBT4057990.1 hypothetical protein [Candidatus Woesearchaeota archaeon]MBT4208735.1 hypothetical protein [Candidatus Woesearchaeota archaeon]MBT4733176.1 hypothetical protein [Candidatus Woesearchaeota archaeon]